MGWYDYLLQGRLGSNLAPLGNSLPYGHDSYFTQAQDFGKNLEQTVTTQSVKFQASQFANYPETPDSMDLILKDSTVNIQDTNPEALARLKEANAALVERYGPRYALRVTSGNDSPGVHVANSDHSKGIAYDVTPANRFDLFVGDISRAITSVLKEFGFKVVDERYSKPGVKSTGPHFHASYTGENPDSPKMA